MDIVATLTLERDISLLLGRQVSRGSSELLGLNPESIKKAYRLQAHRCHPDKATQLGSKAEVLARRFNELTEAHARVQDALNNGSYQKLLANIHQVQPGPGRSGPTKFWRPGGSASPSQSASAPYAPGQARTEAGARGTEARSRSRSASGRPGDAKDQPSTEAGHKGGRRSFFHRGPMPRSVLRLGQFLYYSGHIDWQTMIDSLTWQYMNRPIFGQLAKDLGLLKDTDILSIQRRRRPGERFGAAAMRLGYLDTTSLYLVLGRQRLLNLPLGRFFLDRGILDDSTLCEALADMQLHNMRFRA